MKTFVNPFQAQKLSSYSPRQMPVSSADSLPTDARMHNKMEDDYYLRPPFISGSNMYIK